MQIGEAFVAVRPDTSKFGPELTRGVEQSGRRASVSLGQALTGGAAVAGFTRLIGAASDLQQAVGGTEAVFGSAGDAIDEFAAHSADAVGLSEASYRQLASFAGNQLKGLGFSAEDAAEQTNTLITMGADLAATFGGTTQEAVQALSATFRGEYDPVERYVAGLRASTVAAKAVEMGLADSGGAISNYARGQATLALLVEGSADAQGQFAREADTAAGAQQRAAAAAENSAAAVGDNFLPVYSQAVAVAGTAADAFGALPAPIQTVSVLLAGMAALQGPASGALGAVTDRARAMHSSFTAAGGGARGLSAAISPGALGTVAAAAGIAMIAQGLADMRAQEDAARDSTRALSDAYAEAGEQGLADNLLLQISDIGPDAVNALTEANISARDLAAAGMEGADGLRPLLAELLATGEISAATAVEIGTLAARSAEGRTASEGMADAQADNAAATAEATGSLDDQVATLQAVADSADAARDKLEALYGVQQSLDQATIDLQESVDATNASIAENGSTVDISTEAGRENLQNLRDQGTAIRDYLVSLRASGASTAEVTAAQRLLTGGLRETAGQAGLSREKTEELISTYARVPRKVTSEIDANPQPAIDGVNRAVGYAAGNWAGRVFTATLGVNAGAAAASLENIRTQASNAGFHIIESFAGPGGGGAGAAPESAASPFAAAGITVPVTIQGNVIGDVDRFADEIAFRAAEKIARTGAF